MFSINQQAPYQPFLSEQPIHPGVRRLCRLFAIVSLITIIFIATNIISTIIILVKLISDCNIYGPIIVQSVSFLPCLVLIISLPICLNWNSYVFIIIIALISIALRAASFIYLMVERNRSWGVCYITGPQLTGFMIGDLIWIVFILGFYYAFDLIKEVISKKVTRNVNLKELIL